MAALAESTVCQRLYVKAGRQATLTEEAFTWRRRTVTIGGSATPRPSCPSLTQTAGAVEVSNRDRPVSGIPKPDVRVRDYSSEYRQQVLY